MKALTSAVKQMLDALAHAHAGEHLSMKEKMSVLGRESETPENSGSKIFEPTKVRSSSNLRRVALYLGSELPAEVMEYVISTCSSLGHELTVLTFQSESSADSLLGPHKQSIEENGIDMELVTLTGEPLKGLARYIRSHPEIAFLACKDSGYLGRSYLKGTQRKDALPVPVVVVTTIQEGTASQDQAISTEEKTAVA